MQENEQIKEQLGAFAGKYGPKTIVPATVTAVAEDDTITVTFSDGTTVEDCRLKAVVKDGDKYVLVPAIGSMVLVAKIENSDEHLVIAVDEISGTHTRIGTVKQIVDADGFVFQKGTDTLWDAVKLLIEALELAVILQGKNIDRAKLLAAKNKFKNILNGA